MPRPSQGKRFKAGLYGAVTLRCVKDDKGTFITFNRLRIAKQSLDRKRWEELVPGWTVTPVGRADLWVRHQNADEGWPTRGAESWQSGDGPTREERR
jgi:hypothetical protein